MKSDIQNELQDIFERLTTIIKKYDSRHRYGENAELIFPRSIGASPVGVFDDISLDTQNILRQAGTLRQEVYEEMCHSADALLDKSKKFLSEIEAL